MSVTAEEHTADKGRRLEAEIARLLTAGGYTARRNVVCEGRSGARHEIDVLAQKTDGLTTFSIMVECKAWDRPVDKEVLAKAAFVAADVRADKTIVVALQGATGGAELSAAQAQLGISRANYAAVVGQNPGDLEPAPPLSLLPPTVDQAFDIAERNNPSLRAADYAEQAAAARVSEARAQRRPSISLQA